MKKIKFGAAHEKASKSLASLNEIGEKINFGNGLTLEDYKNGIENVASAIDTYNGLITKLKNLNLEIKEKMKELKDLNVRFTAAVIAMYGRNSKIAQAFGLKPTNLRKSTNKPQQKKGGQGNSGPTTP